MLNDSFSHTGTRMHGKILLKTVPCQEEKLLGEILAAIIQGI